MKKTRTKINGQVRAPRFLHESVRYGVARTFQTPKLLESLTVFQHLEMGLSISQGPSGKQALFSAIRHRKNRIVCTRGKAIRLLSQVGIQDVANLGVEELPHGHRKLVEIARALATDPDLLLLDEPAAGLESKEIANLRALLKEIASTGITIVLVEHNMDLVLAVSDRVTVLDQGSVIATGSPNHIGQNKRVISAYLGSDDDATSS